MFEQLIINNIDLEAYNLSNDVDLHDKIKTTYNIFKNEYGHEIKRQGSEIKAFKEWLQGLPTVLTVPFYNDEILNIGYAHELISADITEEEEDKFLADYWINLAKAFFTLKDNL